MIEATKNDNQRHTFYSSLVKKLNIENLFSQFNVVVIHRNVVKYWK